MNLVLGVPSLQGRDQSDSEVGRRGLCRRLRRRRIRTHLESVAKLRKLDFATPGALI